MLMVVIPGVYGGQPIKMLGYFEGYLELGRRYVLGKIQVSNKGSNLLAGPH